MAFGGHLRARMDLCRHKFRDGSMTQVVENTDAVRCRRIKKVRHSFSKLFTSCFGQSAHKLAEKREVICARMGI